MKNLIQFDVDPQQTMLGNLQTGIQIVATINMETLIDGYYLQGKDKIAMLLGNKLIELLEVNGSLINAIDPTKHINNIIEETI